MSIYLCAVCFFICYTSLAVGDASLTIFHASNVMLKGFDVFFISGRSFGHKGNKSDLDIRTEICLILYL